MNTGKIKSTLLEALREAGTIMIAGASKAKDIRKKSEVSIVTETDLESEKRIVEIIRSSFPDHAFLTEESPPEGNSASRWIIDPVDGTTNFAHNYPVSCVSIAYEENGCLEAGGVFDPFRNELFFALRGEGAFLNGRPIKVSKIVSLSDALLATGFPYDCREKADEYLAVFKKFMMRVQGLRRAGAAAIDLCYVACGRFDGYWENNLNAWDKAAGMLIIREAGGKVTDYAGNPLTLEASSNLASNGLLHDAMLEILNSSGTA